MPRRADPTGVLGGTRHPERDVELRIDGDPGGPDLAVVADPSCPMTAMADLGLVTDAGDLLVTLASRLDISVANEVPRA
jgi:hypothetical protein